ncbi:hypothetical protein A7X76_13870 [Stenotrophomonas maltophilia]|uniref:hypothetical protein n=1 Tax=Stenotrophomonas maltophilia TaxID=40324 RepID=UPI000DA96C38|nr:hypothetical protein [Stenotrophomonas maltophilia]PZS68254.1 hypothetical protein A7X76_13870 [Stenotrophomonas maltophilia]
MATTKKPAKKAPGRPRKAPEDKLEQFSVRLPPKLKFGLELLARAQHRSLSQAVEWAVQVGLNSFDVDNEKTPLGTLLSEVWGEDSPEQRLLAIYQRAPTLLTFEERSVCELLCNSNDLQELHREANSKYQASDRSGPGAFEEQAEEWYWRVVMPHWARIQEVATNWANSGKALQGVSIAAILGFFKRPEYRGLPLLEIYEREAGVA